LSGREGFGFLSPSRRACEAGFIAFQEMKRLFFTAPEVKKQRRTEVTEVTRRGLCLTGRVRLVLSVCACLGLVIGRGDASGHDQPDAVTRPVTINRTRPVTRGGLLETTGRRYCGIRFV
jgi:hypothetical protein